MPVRLIGSSKFEALLGARRPARVFTAATEWGPAAPVSCSLKRRSEPSRVRRPGIRRSDYLHHVVDGLSVGTVDAGQLVIYSIGPGYFVQPDDTTTSDALRQGLGLRAPSC
jgi:hypothetical protein